ncbi:hypothetical protein GLAREA_08556 [Glarea lozoyensis ATCC 20868]|uniref:BTB domain-containing protein n=1 Tax=Glarea lozoyensis (strain ATCC 20868 / MF5171) TaxID=1116229 RepID=S3DDG6_GLAL2|nr:uncharacterized protein GLAREA_08556 [Glarea lozoyensis ATCC 20868]EPE24703.1 hypothetical protein GLAREA_08556 [Glarea lozoyensis ATCC 20868]
MSLSCTEHDFARLKPLVFRLHCMKPDMRIQVFEQIFHIHSVILKAHSEFFHKYLDSPDKKRAEPMSAFKYSWVTQIDDDGSWSLTAEQNTVPDEYQAEFTGIKEEEIAAFDTLLNAMYQNPIRFNSLDHLNLCAELADYYRCIPALSRALEGGLLRSPEVTISFRGECCRVLAIARKLKHKLLFKEALIHSLGPWNAPRFEKLTDPTLRVVAGRALDGILQKLGQFHTELLDQAVHFGQEEQAWLDVYRKFYRMATEHRDVLGRTVIPAYFRAIADGIERLEIPRSLLGVMQPLTTNKLKFDVSDWRSGQKGGAYYNSFLCGDIEDEDLPWEEDDD